MASQRHKILEQGSSAAGEIHAEGAVAPGIAMQVDPSNPNVMMPREDLPPTVEVPHGEPGGPLSGSSLTGAIPEGAEWPTPPEPPPGDVAPVLTSLAPAEGPIQTGDLTVRIIGTGFTESSVMVWNGADDVCAYVSETELTTIVKTDMASEGSTCTVAVRNGDELSNELTFELTEEEPTEEELPPGARTFPIGPSNIGLVTDHEEGLEIGLIDALDVQEGDVARVEATGNTSVNGEYTVLSVNPLVVANNLILETPIENKGRLTVIAGA